MKIPLIIKPYFIKVYSTLFIFSLVASIPFQANASIISDLTAIVLGSQAKAEETPIVTLSSTQNSQNVALLNSESSINPDIKNLADSEDMIIVQDDSFIYSDRFAIPDIKFEKSTISDQIKIYTVQEGDTLSEIAETFDVSINTIRWENNLSGNTVSIGQKLKILPVTGVKHIVKSGDTISKIADKYDAELEDTLVFNGITKDYSLKTNEIIFVPNGIIKAVSSPKATTSSKNTTVSSNTKAPSGYYMRPVSGIITSPYGSRKGGFHYGIDIGNKRGTSIMASASGTVSKVVNGCKEGNTNCGGRYGNYVVISHSNGTKTFYAHLSSTSVSVGQKVKQGQVIGGLGNTGRSTGPHLHFEVENANGSKMKPQF